MIILVKIYLIIYITRKSSSQVQLLIKELLSVCKADISSRSTAIDNKKLSNQRQARYPEKRNEPDAPQVRRSTILYYLQNTLCFPPANYVEWK